jgi:general secretion pathway protein H
MWLVRQRQDARNGFTLLELLVVVSLLGIMATTLPYFTGESNGPKIRQATQGIAADIVSLRDRAVRRRVVTELIIGANGYSAGELVRSFPPGLVVSYEPARAALVDEGENRILFYPDGSATGGLITVRRGGSALIIRIDWLNGRVSIDE